MRTAPRVSSQVILQASGFCATVASGLARVYPPLEHYDYPELDERCVCRICKEWRESYAAYMVAYRAAEGHDPNCSCESCRAVYRVRSSYQAALNRRDLYCESSYQAQHKPKELPFLRWLQSTILNRGERSDGWWATKATHPTSYWPAVFRQTMAASGATSGAAA